MAEASQLPYLIKLLDDESEATQSALKKEFEKFQGDVSDDLASLAIDLSPEDRYRVSQLLHPCRREKLTQQWAVPDNLDDDWETFEHLLRLLCDYMHDGISLRSSLNDSLDILADDSNSTCPPHREQSKKIPIREKHFTGARQCVLFNSDICYTLETGKGNPITSA